MENYYEVLGVAQDAPVKVIKKAYYKLAKKYHPDFNAGNAEAEAKFKIISEAYSCLSNADKRKDYDEELKRPKHNNGMGAAPGAGRPTGQQRRSSARPTSQGVNFEDISRNFAAFYGFNPKTGEVTDEENLSKYAAKDRKKNPLDVSDMFDKFMGIHKR